MSEKADRYIRVVLGGMSWGVLLWPSSHLGWLLGGTFGLLCVVDQERKIHRDGSKNFRPATPPR